MLHEGLVWKISTGGASPLRGAGPWRSYSINLSIAILGQAIRAKLAIFVVMAWPNMATYMVNIDFFANIRINKCRSLAKKELKKIIGFKVLAKTKFFDSFEPP